ncbi:hypothetical protein Esti_005884 [Eimeria stiedai]
MPEKPSAAGIRCSCEICLLHPHLKEALSRMQPPELRLYSHAELMELLQHDISIADDANKFRVGSDESWWHLCAADPTFPFYFIPTKEFIHSLASYVACRVRYIWSNQRRRTDCWPSTKSEAACDHPGDGCCSKRILPDPVRILECGAGTGLLAAHLVPSLRGLLQQDGQTSGSNAGYAEDAKEQRSPLDEGVAQQRAFQKDVVSDASRQKRALNTTARASCCACCKEAGDNASNALQHLGCACQVQEYILIGHAEGGLVGRPFETWGLSCPQENALPLGVDYEDPQEAPMFSSNSTAQPQSQAAVSAAIEVEKQLQGFPPKCGENDDDECAADAHWRPQNSFTFFPPMREEAINQAIDPSKASEAESDGPDTATHFGGMELLPLESRPYHQDGFTRLPPLPRYEEKGTSYEAPEEEKRLQMLQGVQQLSRFDSLHSLLKGCPSVSRVVVFRRTFKKYTLNAP